MSGTLKIEKEIEEQKSNQKNKTFLSIQELLIAKGLLLCMIGFLLGRAVILQMVSPFALAFLATVWIVYHKRLGTIVLFMTLGAWTYSIEQAVFVCISAVIFLLVTYFFKERHHNKFVIFTLFAASVSTRIFLYSLKDQLNLLDWLSIFVEGFLTIILLFIFMQSIPLIALKKFESTLKNEELICIIILIASILTGLIGWQVYIASLEHVFARYIVLVFALIGGAAIGSTVGVVTGVVLCLANIQNLFQVTLLAFSGMLGGLLKEGRRIGVSAGLLVGTFLVGIYGGFGSLGATMLESTIAIILFYFTPLSLLEQISRYVPGTTEHSFEERKYLQKVRDITAQRVEQFSAVFEALSKSFIQSTEKQNEQEMIDETDYFLSLVTEKTCQLCFMKKRCWQNQFDKTYALMSEIKDDLVMGNDVNVITLNQFENYCVKAKKVVQTMESEVSILQINKKLKHQVAESKKIVAEQLKGVSDVMDNFAQEIVKERKYYEKQEIQIIRMLKEMNINIENIDIYQLDKGNIDIEMAVIFSDYRGEDEKLIAPALSDILEETIIVKETEISRYPDGVSFITLGSAKQYTVETGVAIAAKGGGLISGDCYAMMELGAGKHAVAISDGMGNGIRAREESSETLRLLEQILYTGISEQVAIKSINSILSLRTTDEVFATLDLAIINLHNAVVRFLKIGSSPSFVKRGNEIIQIEANNLPIGIIEHVELDAVSASLKSGDILIMMSDGVFEGVKNVANNDMWMKRKIEQLKTKDPQAIADLLLEAVIREEQGMIHDDMTIVVTKIAKHVPKWSKIPVTSSV